MPRAKEPHRQPHERLESTAPAAPALPTRAAPGSEEKVRILTERAARRQELHVRGDAEIPPASSLRAGLQAIRAETSGVERKLSTFSKTLKSLRSRRGWSIRGTARRAGLSHTAVRLLEADLVQPRLTTLRALARALRVSLDTLAGL